MSETNKAQKLGGEIVIYKAPGGPELKVSFQNESLWLTQAQISELFQTDRTSIGRHLQNVFKTAELREDSVCAKIAHTAQDGKTYRVSYYNLDAIIAVGYRVNSKRATEFRIWATSKLRDYILKGFAVNQERLKDRKGQESLKEYEKAISLLQAAVENRRLEGYEKELLNIILDYSKTWIILNKYDEQKLIIENVTKKSVALKYEKVKKSIDQFRTRLFKDAKRGSDLFGKEVSNKLEALLGNIEQTFDGKPLYASFEEKAAHLLYFAIKDHPFADGNKRIGALLFILYLVENHRVYNKKGERFISENALTALAILIAESRPDHKEVMVKVVANMITKK